MRQFLKGWLKLTCAKELPAHRQLLTWLRTDFLSVSDLHKEASQRREQEESKPRRLILCSFLSPAPQHFREVEPYSPFTSQTSQGNISKMLDAEGGASVYCLPYIFLVNNSLFKIWPQNGLQLIKGFMGIKGQTRNKSHRLFTSLERQLVLTHRSGEGGAESTSPRYSSDRRHRGGAWGYPPWQIVYLRSRSASASWQSPLFAISTKSQFTSPQAHPP